MKGMPVSCWKSGQRAVCGCRGERGPFFKRQMNLRGCGAFDMDNDGRMDVLLTSMAGLSCSCTIEELLKTIG